VGQSLKVEYLEDSIPTTKYDRSSRSIPTPLSKNEKEDFMTGDNEGINQPKIKFSRTMPDGSVHEIELPAPTSIVMSRSISIESGNLVSEEDVLALMFDMFNHSEITFEYYSEYGKPRDTALKEAINREDIIEVRSECYYYKHPEDGRSFVKINSAERELFDWEKDLIREQPSYIKSTLRLSERKKREYETWHKIEMEEEFKRMKQAEQFYYDVFLSYSEKDHLQAQAIHEKLEKAGARVFMAPKSLRAGDDFAEKIRKSLVGSSELWVILSPNSLNSEWVTTEWGAAWVLGKLIVPILFRCDIPQLPERLRKFHCIDAGALDEFIHEKFHGK